MAATRSLVEQSVYFGVSTSSGSIGVIEDFFGAPLGGASGEVDGDDVINLPPRQLAELLYRIVSANKVAYQKMYESNEPEQSALVLSGGPRAWDQPASVNHIKSAIMYMERPLIPDPIWDAVEEVVSFTAIAHGWDARHGLLDAFELIDEIRLFDNDQPFYTANQRGRPVYPAQALINRIARIEGNGNNARPLLTVGLRRAAELAPVLRADSEISLRPYPDSRMGSSYTPKQSFDSQGLFASSIYSTLVGRGLPSGDEEWEVLSKWEALKNGSGSLELRASASSFAASQKRRLMLKHLRDALHERGLRDSPNWEEIVMDLGPAGMQIFVSEPHDIEFLNQLSAVLENLPRSAELAHWTSLPGVSGATFKDLAALRTSEEAFHLVRRAISRIMTASFAEDLSPELARRQISEAAKQELRPEIDRLQRNSRRSATLPNVLAGIAGFGVGLMSFAAGEPLAGSIGAAAAQVPWATEFAAPRDSTTNALLKVYGLLVSDRDELGAQAMR